jgi:hypothetical protein
VDPRAGLDDVENRKFLTLPGLELRPLGRPARSQSLYRLRYPSVEERIFRIFENNMLRAYLFIYLHIVSLFNDSDSNSGYVGHGIQRFISEY